MGAFTYTGQDATLTKTSSTVIQSIQQGTITIASGSNSNTATISSVTTSKTMLVWGGINTDISTQTTYGRAAVRITLTNSTTVTATREQNTTNNVTVNFTVVEFSSGVNSIQYGTITCTSQASNTGTISSVGSNAFVLWLGASTAAGALPAGDILTGVQLTNSTTVTAFSVGNITITTAFVVVDLDTTIVSSIQQRSVSSSAASATDTDTISSVTTGRTWLAWGGSTSAASQATSQTYYTAALTNPTTVTFTRIAAAATNTRAHYYTAVVLDSGVVNSIQRGTIALSAATSNTATISSVTTAKSFANWCGELATSANANTVNATLSLTNSTTVTSAVPSAGSETTSYEVVQFN